MKQKTIRTSIFIEGMGVHTGEPSSVTLRPSEPNSGIVLIHKQIPDKPLVIGTFVPEPAMHATVLKGEGWAVSTVEHLLSALSGLGIDNISVEISGNEVPILDGSALPFVQALKKAGIIEQAETKVFLTPVQTLKFEDQGRFIEITPALKGQQTLTFDYSVEFEHPLLQQTSLSGVLSPQFYAKKVAPARTFGFLDQLPFLRKHGLARGTTLGNTVVVGEDMFLNSRRFTDELIRHKLLDLLGDLALLGKQLVGSIRAHKTGHNFNRQVIQHLLDHPDQWQIR